MTKLHFWDDGDRSVGIGGNQTVIELELDGATAEGTVDNIEHAKETLARALSEIWDNGLVYSMTDDEIARGRQLEGAEAAAFHGIHMQLKRVDLDKPLPSDI